MKYTVLGAGGFIGGQLKESLDASGMTCYAPLRGDDRIFEEPLGHVFYCIGLTNDFKDRPYDTVDAHVSFLNKILQKASFDRLVYLSSTRLYDGLSGDLCREDMDLRMNPSNPRHIYDLSKALGENMCLTASQGRACAVRLSSVYGSAPKAKGFLPDLLRQISQEKSFSLNSATGIVRDYIHIDDVVRGLIRILDGDETGIVNVASGENVSNQEIAEILNALGYAVELQRQSDRELRPVCDISKLRTYGINPVHVCHYLQDFIKSGSGHGTH